MKNRLMQSIEIDLQPSLLLLGVLLLISILACASVIILAIPFGIKLCLLATIIFSSIYFMLRDALLALPWSWQRVQVNGKGELTLTNQQGQQFRPILHATSFIHPWLVILNTQKNKSDKWFSALNVPVLILPVDIADQHRQLRVWLKWWKHEPSVLRMSGVLGE